MPKIFLSYAHADWEDGCTVHNRLAEQGFEVISDLALDYSSYHELSASIVAAVNQCDVVIVVLTPSSIKTVECQYEWQHAAASRKPIIPLIFAHVSPPPALACRDYVDFTGNFEKAIKQLVKKLDWFTSTPYLQLRRKMMRYLNSQKTVKTTPPKIGNAYKEFGRLITQRLSEWGDGVEKLARLLDIEVELAQAVMDGTMPPTTLDQEFIDEIVTLLQLDKRWVQLVFAAATSEPTLTFHKHQMNTDDFATRNNINYQYADSHYNNNNSCDSNVNPGSQLEANTMNDAPTGNPNDASSRKQGNLELLRRAIVEWSPDAFKAVDELYNRLFVSWVVNHPRYDDLRAYAPHLTPEDILQEAYTKLHRTLNKRDDFYAKFPTIANFMAYCRTTIGNLIQDQLPKKQRQMEDPETAHNTSTPILPPVSVVDELGYQFTDPTSDPSIMEHQLDWKLLMEQIITTLNQEEMLIFKHKILGNPDRDELRNAGKTPQETERIWKRARRKLLKDTKLRAMVDMSDSHLALR